ncbi:MAG: hypothetical protein ACYS7M_02655 [Planctomycetota bacterium]
MSHALRLTVPTVLSIAVALGGCRREPPPPPLAPSSPQAAPAPASADKVATPPPGAPEASPPPTASAPAITGREQLPPGHPPIDSPPQRPPQRSGAAKATEADGELTVAGLRFDIPEGWESQKPRSSMRAAQYSLPGEAGPAELAVFPGIGGTVQANIDRWIAQFKDPENPDGKVDSEVKTFEKGGLKLSIVRASGTHTPARMGPSAPPTDSVSAYALFGVIVEGGPQGTLFIKTTGPLATINAHGDALTNIAQSATLVE